MISNKNLLKSKLTESLKEVKYSLNINDKVDAIVESLNACDDDKSWTSKLNRDTIKVMINKSNEINKLVESICNTVCGGKLVESKKPLREGPGAGYSVKGSVSSLRDIKILDTKSETNKYGENEITVTATANCDIENVSASSYYYGRDIVDGAAIPATIELNFTYWESEFKGESPEQIVKYYNEFEFDCGLGGGWSHSTFTGEISGDYNDVEKDPYGCDTNTFTITIQNERVINDIDLAVTGEDWQDEYIVEYDDGTEEYFETKEEAIADAKKNRGISVTHRQLQFALVSDFESEDVIDEYDEGVVWERDYDKQYKYDEEDVEEAFAKRDVYVNDEYKFSSNNYKTNKELLNKIRQDRKVKYAGQKAIATAGTELDEIEIKPEDKVKVRKSKRESLDDKVTYVIYKENGKYKGTPKSNYDAQVRNANMVQDYSKFNDANQIIDYLTKYTSNKDKSQYKVVEECAKQVTENVNNTSENNIRQKLQSIQDKISNWTSARGIVVTDLAEYDGTPETMTEGEAGDFIRGTLNKSLYEMNDKLQEVIDIEDDTIYDEFDDLAKVVKKAKDLMEDNLTEQTYKKISKDLFDPFFKLNESTNKKACRNCFKESVIDKSKLFTSKKKNVKESLDGETYSKVLDAFPNLNVAYDDEEPFFIVDSWDEAIELQKFLAPDYEPKSDTDTRKLDEILDDKWGFSDMFTACYGCGELIDFGSSNPDDYGIVDNDGIYCEACIKQNPDDYLDNLINNPRRANTCLDQSDFESKGFEVVGDNFENGLYGRVDSPDKILKDLLAKYPDGEFVFDAKHGRSPYAVNFQVFGRNLGNDNESENDDTDESLKENKSNKLGFFVLNNEIDENQLKDLGLEYDKVRGNYLVKGTPGELVKLAKTLGMDATEEELINAADSQFSRVRSVNESINEKWIQFKFEDGSNPYVAKTKEEQDRMFKKYKDRVEQVSDITYLVKNKNVKETLDDTQNLINDAKKFAKENNKDVKVTGLVSSNECSISTFPEDFNEMVKLFNTKFDVYDEDSELERFKIKSKLTNESLNLDDSYTQIEVVDGNGETIKYFDEGEGEYFDGTTDEEIIEELSDEYGGDIIINRVHYENGLLDYTETLYDGTLDENLKEDAPIKDRKPHRVFSVGDRVKYVNNDGWSKGGERNIGDVGSIVDRDYQGNLEVFTIKRDKPRKYNGYYDNTFLANPDNLDYFDESLKEGKIKIKDEIQRLVDKYSKLQKQYHGDSSASKKVEAEIDRLQCLLDTGKEYIDENLKEDVQKLNAKIYYEEDGEPIIVFKSIGDRKGNFDAYVHNGQHTVAAPDYVKTLKKANLNDQKVKDLIAEYESNYPVKLNLKESKKDWIRVKQDGAWYIVDDSSGKEIDGPFETLKETEDAGYGHLEYIAPRTDENLNERVAKYSNKPDKLTASEFFDSFDFTIYKTQNEDGEEVYKLRDNQGANLGDIEDDELDLVGAVDRLDPMYYDDYILRPLEEETYELSQTDSKYDNLYSLLHHNHSYEEILDELVKLNDEENLNAYITLIYYIVHPDELVDDVLTDEELFENLFEKKDKYKVLQGNWGYGWDDIDEIKLTDDKEENIKNSNELAKKVMVSKETKPANKYRMKIKRRKAQENINESDDSDAQYSIKYWADDVLRDQGIADYYGEYSDLDEAKDVCDWLVDKGYAVSAEVVDEDESVLYGSYPEDESLKEYGSIMSYLDDSIKK